jgi:hypothetical protein
VTGALKHLLIGLLVGLSLAFARAAEWQWSREVENGNSPARAFLWIPPDCKQVRAVVFAQNNMIEEGILQHAQFRGELSRLGIAELFVAPFFDYWQQATNNDAANARFSAMLQSFASASGYAELEFAPVIPMGHSASASMPWNFAAWNPERTLAILSIHGDAPRTTLVGNSRPNVDWGNRNIDGIPGLMVMGEYEWWEDRLTPAIAFRAKYPKAPVALLCDEGHGHFDYSDQLVNYLALFIRKAAEQRLPKRVALDQPVKLKSVNPQDGWLIDRWRKGEKPHAKAAKFAMYSGDIKESFWAFDKEMVGATENFNPQFGKKPQLVGFVQDGKIVDQTPNTHEQIRLKLPPLDDSLSFKLTGAFLDSVPPGNPAKWTGLTNGAPLRHATGGGPVILSRISGPVIQTAPDTFAVRYNRASVPTDHRAGDIWLLASHPGDAHYRSVVQQGVMKIPLALSEGAEQHISFPPLPDQKRGSKSLRLTATSDANAPVYYYVMAGPAEVNGETLVFTKIPPRAKLPIEVTVLAWQWGRNSEPKLKSAVPVERTLCIYAVTSNLEK